jgi:hypothetical protein
MIIAPGDVYEVAWNGTIDLLRQRAGQRPPPPSDAQRHPYRAVTGLIVKILETVEEATVQELALWTGFHRELVNSALYGLIEKGRVGKRITDVQALRFGTRGEYRQRYFLRDS